MGVITKNHKNGCEDWIIQDSENQILNMLSAIWDVNHHQESEKWLQRWVMSESWSNMTTWIRILSVLSFQMIGSIWPKMSSILFHKSLK